LLSDLVETIHLSYIIAPVGPRFYIAFRQKLFIRQLYRTSADIEIPAQRTGRRKFFSAHNTSCPDFRPNVFVNLFIQWYFTARFQIDRKFVHIILPIFSVSSVIYFFGSLNELLSDTIRL